MKNVLITGGLGFIGLSLLKKLLIESDSYITILDISDHCNSKLAVKTLTEMRHICDRYKIVRIDLSKTLPTIIDSLINNQDVIYHLASTVGVRTIDNNPNYAIKNILAINIAVFEAAAKFNKKIIYASTSEIYGNSTDCVETNNLIIGTSTTSRWCYSSCKLTSEFLLRSYDTPSIIVRPFNIVGYGQHSEGGAVLPNFIKAAVHDEPIVIYGTGEQSRSFCDVRDAINALYILSCTESCYGNIYNIGNPNNIATINQLADIVLKAVNSKSEIVYSGLSNSFKNDFVDIGYRIPNILELRKYYTPTISMQEIVNSGVSFYT